MFCQITDKTKVSSLVRVCKLMWLKQEVLHPKKTSGEVLMEGKHNRYQTNILREVGYVTSRFTFKKTPCQMKITESQNGRSWKGPLWVIWSNPLAEAGCPTAGCRGPCPGGSWISPEKETPQPPWAACSSAPSPSESRSSSSCSDGTSYAFLTTSD